MTRSLFLASFFALTMPACAGQIGAPADNDASLADDAKADRTGGGTSYYVVRPDLRRCAAPACGGAFVRRVNFATTTCADGTSAAECYVAAADYSKAGLDDNDMTAVAARPMIVKGRLADTSYVAGRFGNLVASEVWVAAVGTTPSGAYAPVSGVVYRVKDNGVRCITSPCPSDHELKLNGTSSRDVAGIDFSAVGASDAEIADAYGALTSADGLLVDGSNTTVSGPGGTLYQLSAANFYAKVAHAPATTGDAQACGGLAGLTCADGQWCDPQPANACGGADLLGTCKDASFACPQVYTPVCGCDGTTYSNDCMRVQAKVQLAHDGACAN